MIFRLATLMLFGTIFMIPAYAMAGGHTVDKFMMADTDKDGEVSKEEFTAKYETKFKNMDSNSDNKVSAEEYEAYMDAKYTEKYKETFDRIDSDDDGMISEEEMLKHKRSSKHKH